MGKYLIFAGIAIAVASVAGIYVAGTQNQQIIFPTDSPEQSAAQEGPVVPEGRGFTPTINKEQWHDDPFADEAAEVRAKAGM